jgi:hypothetical protein
MAHLNTHGYIEPALILYNNEYWDFNLLNTNIPCGDTGKDTNLIALIDATDSASTASEVCIAGVPEYTWEKAVTTSAYTLYNVGRTMTDNGLIEFDKNDITDDEFLSVVSGSAMEVSEEAVLHLCPVSANTQEYVMDVAVNTDSGTFEFNGGFYQGFFMTECGVYQILPIDLSEKLGFAFELKSGLTEFSGTSGETSGMTYLNEKYPNNSGIFFYIGTMAENKWWKYYSIDNTLYERGNIEKLHDESSGLSGYTFETNEGYPLKNSSVVKFDSNNKYLTYNRTRSGLTAQDGNVDEVTTFWYDGRKYNENLYLMMNRTPSGYTVEKLLQHEDEVKNGGNSNDYNVIGDLYSNALAFRITEDGRIGFRYLIHACDNEKSVLESNEEYSKPGLIDDQWHFVYYSLNRISTMYMQVYIYVDNNLVYVSKILPILNLRQLNDIYEKQEGVPFVISLGGGTLGLGAAIYDNYTDTPAYRLPLERNFAGTFIGKIKRFGITSGDGEYSNVMAVKDMFEKDLS